MEYLNQYRINRAAEMLLGTDESIEDIAYDCGFNDISYFIKLFKRYKNKTPLKYRAEGQEETAPVQMDKKSEYENEKTE